MKDFSFLAEEMSPLIHSIIRSLNIYKNYDEYYQTALIALWQASLSFDPEKGKFKTYAYAYIRGRLLTELREEAKKDRSEIYAEDYELAGILDENGRVQENCIVLHDIIKQLPEKYIKFAEMYFLYGMKLTEITDMLGIAYNTAKQWKKEVIKRLKDNWENS